MGMSKDELKEMIDNTIFQNGNGQITGNGLNLVLNAIAENAGGGLQTLFFTFDNSGPVDSSFENLDSNVQESMLEHNKQIFDIIMTIYVNFLNSIEYVDNDTWGDLYGNFNFDHLLEFTKNMLFNCCVWDYYNSGGTPWSFICNVVWVEDQGMESSAVVEEESGNIFENFCIYLYDRIGDYEYRLYSDGHLEYPNFNKPT